MRARSLSWGATLVATTLLVTACGGTAATNAPSAAPSSAAPASSAPAPSSTDAGASRSPVAVQLPAPEKTKVTIGQSGEWSAGNLHAAIAEYTGLDERFGLDVTFTPFSGGSQVVQALVAGQVDVSDNSGGPVIASLATDVPLEMTFVTRSNLTDNLYTAKDVKTADDLKGKSIAISSFGSQSHAGALLALKKLGLTTDDVTITQVGNDSARLAALQGGSVAGSMNDSTRAAELEGLGFNTLVKLAEVEGLGGVPRTSMTVTKEFAQQNPNLVLALTAMYYEANLMWRENPELAAEALASLAKMDPADAKTDVDTVLKEKWEPLDGRCDAAVMDFTKQTLIEANPDVADVDASQACTNEFLDKLTELGWTPDTTPPSS